MTKVDVNSPTANMYGCEPCPKCGAPFLTERGGRGKRFLACWREGCGYRREAGEG